MAAHRHATLFNVPHRISALRGIATLWCDAILWHSEPRVWFDAEFKQMYVIPWPAGHKDFTCLPSFLDQPVTRNLPALRHFLTSRSRENSTLSTASPVFVLSTSFPFFALYRNLFFSCNPSWMPHSAPLWPTQYLSSTPSASLPHSVRRASWDIDFITTTRVTCTCCSTCVKLLCFVKL